MRKNVLPLLICTLMCSASVQAATSGSIILFDGVGYDFTSIDLETTTFQDIGDGNSLGTSFAGSGLGYYEGATVANDRLYLTDETDGGGEDIAILTGPNALTYEFDTSASLDYVMDRDVGGADPHGVEWVTDASDGTLTDNDFNIWVVRASNFLLSALDRDGYAGVGSIADWTVGSVTDIGLNVDVGMTKSSAMCKSVDGSRIYAGGTVISPTGEDLYGYKILSVTTNQLISDNAVILPDMGKPFGPQPPAGDIIHFAFHAMATDRANDAYLALVKNGTDTAPTRVLYRFDDLPDPDSNLISSYTQPGGARSVRLDDVLTFNTRPDRMGMATGRAVDVGGGTLYPVIYILNGTDGTDPPRLYTLVPQQTSNDVERRDWRRYR